MIRGLKTRLAHWIAAGRDIRGDLYHALFTMGWPAFIFGIGIVFVLANGGFALAYLAQPGAVVHARPGSFADAFFFSVQTMATIGYGIMYPGTFYANVLMSLETLIGLFGVAFATGLAFARFSRPRARIRFSETAVVSLYHGVPTLMFRVANQRGNQILEARVQVTLLRNEHSPEGQTMRRFRDLVLLRDSTPSFSYSWTVMHPITGNSPLSGASRATLEAEDAELVVTMAGLDETLSQTIHARHVYRPAAIHWGHRLRDVLSKDTHGRYLIDYGHFDDTEIEPPKT
ncbi:ion channel [Acidiferrobacter sp.]|uniref:ion channel n=1 Tax=Acidiferrobacter sp. TaxID=1872107 RepID=UPI00260C49C7|nr:ion channel [Acidiferrobacter sp.]